MKKYNDRQEIVTVRYEKEQVKEINDLSLRLGIPRNIVIKRFAQVILEDMKDGRKIFAG